jgi:MoxR-like ATPase
VNHAPTRPQAYELLQKVREEFKKGIIGQTAMIDGLLLAVLANGHVLVEGVPGLAKTRAVNLLAQMCKVSFKRLQFTPDILPADVVGTQIYNVNENRFSTKKGPVFSHFILADEINRAPAKVQSALLEAMQEKQVTIAEETFPLPVPFFVFATQNPVEQEGTYPLPEAQVDRFLIKLVVDYPNAKEEADIVKMVMNETKLPELDPILDADTILGLQHATRQVFIEDKIVEYVTNLVFASRYPDRHGMPNLKDIIDYGSSPRASIALAMVAKANAIMNNRDMVIPEDVKAVALPVLRHRIIPTYQADAEGITSTMIVEEILKKTRVP